LKLTTTSLVPKLVNADAAERRNGVLDFTDSFKAHIVTHIGDRSKDIETVSGYRNILGMYDPSLASLEDDEMLVLVRLLLFQFEALKASP